MFLPPLASEPGSASEFDSSLLSILNVNVVDATSAGPDVLVSFTSEGTGPARLRVAGGRKAGHYKVVAKARDLKLRRGRTYAIEVYAGPYLLGAIDYVSQSRNAIPIAFQISNHPALRIASLQAAGFSTEEIASTIQTEFGLDGRAVLDLLAYGGFSATELANLAYDLFGYSPDGITALLASLGYSGAAVAEALSDGLGASPADALTLLAANFASFGAADAAEALTIWQDIVDFFLNTAGLPADDLLAAFYNGVSPYFSALFGSSSNGLLATAQLFHASYSGSPGGFVALLISLGADPVEAGYTLLSVFGLTAEQTAAILAGLGQSASAITQVLSLAGDIPPATLVGILAGAGVSCNSIALVLKDDLELSLQQVSDALLVGGCSVEDAGNALVATFTGADIETIGTVIFNTLTNALGMTAQAAANVLAVWLKVAVAGGTVVATVILVALTGGAGLSVVAALVIAATSLVSAGIGNALEVADFLLQALTQGFGLAIDQAIALLVQAGIL